MDRLEAKAYRGLVSEGRRLFGAGDWKTGMGRYRGNPHAFARNVLGSRWWSAQEEVGRALASHRRVAVRSGNGVGKTYLAADLALWFLYSHSPAMVITTAPTWRQVRKVLWREIGNRVATARVRLPGRMLQTQIEVGREAVAIGLSAEGGVQFQGFHCENLLIILDEASGIPDEIWDAAEGVAVGTNNKILAIGNPLLASGRFYDVFKKASGWHKMTISALNHPNVTGKGKVIPGCVTEGFIDEKVVDWCEVVESRELRVESNGPDSSVPFDKLRAGSRNDGSVGPDVFWWKGKLYRPSDLFRMRVQGEFPRSDQRALIPLSWIEAAQIRVLEAKGSVRAAADVARFGRDWTIIGLRTGSVVRDVIPIQGADLVEVAGEISRLAYAEGPESIAIDVIGYGAGVVDILEREGIAGIDSHNSSARANDPEHYVNRRAEQYWGLRERFRTGDIQIPPDDLLAEELACLRYHYNARGLIQIDSKEDIRRIIKRSPDRADMLAMLMDSSWDSTWDYLRNPEERVYLEPSPAELLRREMAGW